MVKIAIEFQSITSEEFADPSARLPSRALELAPAALEILKGFDRSCSLGPKQRQVIERFVFAVQDVLWGGGEDRARYENRRYRKIRGDGPCPQWPNPKNVRPEMLPIGTPSKNLNGVQGSNIVSLSAARKARGGGE
jgi:hypothetical protein